MIRFDRKITQNLDEALRREWIDTNGIGGFASSTIANLNTRRYHGLLVASIEGAMSRMVMLSRFEEEVVLDGTAYPLSSNEYPNAIHPLGYKNLDAFELDLCPKFIYRVGNTTVEKTLMMVYGDNATLIRYTFTGPEKKKMLNLRPLIGYRGYHELTHRNAAIIPRPLKNNGHLTYMPYKELPPVYFYHNADKFEEVSDWYLNFKFREEEARGLDHFEDLFSPGIFHFNVEKGDACFVLITATEKEEVDVRALYDQEVKRREKLRKSAAVFIENGTEKDSYEHLAAAADSFLVKGYVRNSHSVIAGYHWFGCWGRDTMIALPGLTLAQGKFTIARNILQSYSEQVKEGLVPNFLSEDRHTSQYNSVDASLWYIYAVYKYFLYSKDFEFVISLYPVLKRIVESFMRGTLFQIGCDRDGLVKAGDSSTQLTWMDVKIGDMAVTPRNGKAVEVNALWYNALRILEEFSRRIRPEETLFYAQLAEKVKISFDEVFWNPAGEYLYDTVDGDKKDAAVRPNQIFPLSLPFPLLTEPQRRKVLEKVQKELLTPYGLRTLARGDKNYCAQCVGNQFSRDKAYHQGTVWSWLIGPFVTAYLRVNGNGEKNRAMARGFLAPFYQHLRDAGVGTVSEIFDAEPPHAPRGCISQAWSVGEVLRATYEDLLKKAPTPPQTTKV